MSEAIAPFRVSGPFLRVMLAELGVRALTEIAFLLGYDNPNSFHRAFAQWTGQTPLAVRGAAGS